MKKKIATRIILIGVAGGLLFWLALGDNFWRGFVAGFVVEELMQLSPWITARIIDSVSRWGSTDLEQREQQKNEIEEAVAKLPGRLVQLLGTLVIILPYAMKGVKSIGINRLSRLRRVGNSAKIVLRRVSLILLVVVLIVGPLAYVGFNGVETLLAGASDRTEDVLTSTAGIISFVTGVVSVLMIIFGGIRYTLSGGDQGAITSAKNTILYAIIGLVVAFIAAGIIEFVIAPLLS